MGGSKRLSARLSTVRGCRWPPRALGVIIFDVPTRLLAIALIAGFLAACTGSDGDPKPTPSPTSRPPTSSVVVSPSPTPSPTGPLTTGPNVRPGEKPPQLPAQARLH